MTKQSFTLQGQIHNAVIINRRTWICLRPFAVKHRPNVNVEKRLRHEFP